MSILRVELTFGLSTLSLRPILVFITVMVSSTVADAPIDRLQVLARHVGRVLHNLLQKRHKLHRNKIQDNVVEQREKLTKV